MPEIVITQAFNHREGSQVTHYPKSEKAVAVSQAVAAHALARGFSPKPEEKAQKPTAKHAAPVPAATTEPSAGK
ncbi:hypothetical protein ACLUTX_12635 [Enterobacterales bacterium AE_CKDN230030158-1A_HGKHYDSX7]